MNGMVARVTAPRERTGHVIRDSSLALATQMIDALVRLNDSVWRRGTVRPALLEMLRLRNARTVNCVFCKSVRYDVARADGLDEETVALIDDDFASGPLSEVEKTVLGFADFYLRRPDVAEPDLLQRLRRHFTVEQICQMAIALATFNASSRCAVALGGMPDSLPVIEMPLPPA